MITETKDGFVEHDCKLSIQGKEFSSGGSCIISKDGKAKGLLYAYPKDGKVGTWDKSKTFPAKFGTSYRSNMGDERQIVHTNIDGKNFVGTYFKTNSDIVRLRETK
jgi:hypothetical protein